MQCKYYYIIYAIYYIIYAILRREVAKTFELFSFENSPKWTIFGYCIKICFPRRAKAPDTSFARGSLIPQSLCKKNYGHVNFTRYLRNRSEAPKIYSTSDQKVLQSSAKFWPHWIGRSEQYLATVLWLWATNVGQWWLVHMPQPKPIV